MLAEDLRQKHQKQRDRHICVICLCPPQVTWETPETGSGGVAHAMVLCHTADTPSLGEPCLL